MSHITNPSIDSALAERIEKINIAKQYLDATQTLFYEFGSDKLASIHTQLTQLHDALTSHQVILVVIGEFSRGKSTLINALLGIDLLRCSQEATTAVNTVIEALPEGYTDKFIRIHYQDDEPTQDIPWTDNEVLERWGTELDKTHANLRERIDHIKIFLSHPLLDKGLVIIDTPGLQSMNMHHERITEQAIAKSHIALWVQSTTQLGGTQTEWQFLANTLRKNFRKFITVINMWDHVIEPIDIQEKQKTKTQREQEKFHYIRKNFITYLPDEDEENIKQMTDSDHLIGVSAIWALRDDPVKKALSNIDYLSERICLLLENGTAFDEIVFKPLQQLLHIQKLLYTEITDELTQLAAKETLAERQEMLKILELEIKNIHTQAKKTALEAQEEHTRVAKYFADYIPVKLLEPLFELKKDIENEVDVNYIKKMLEQKVENIGLPHTLHVRFKQVDKKIEKIWQQEKKQVYVALKGLSTEYTDKTNKHFKAIKKLSKSLQFDIKPFVIEFDISSIEQHHVDILHIEREILAQQKKINNIDQEKLAFKTDHIAIKKAKFALKIAEKKYIDLGEQPKPLIQTKSKLVREEGMYNDAEYKTITVPDYSNVEAWQFEIKKQQACIDHCEAYLQTIIEEEYKKTGILMSLDNAKKKHAKEKLKLAKQKIEVEKKLNMDISKIIEEIKYKLLYETKNNLKQKISYIEKNIPKSIYKLFDDQFNILNQCIKEQYVEPVNAKYAKYAEITLLLQKDITEIHKRQESLKQAQQKIIDLQSLTQYELEN